LPDGDVGALGDLRTVEVEHHAAPGEGGERVVPGAAAVAGAARDDEPAGVGLDPEVDAAPAAHVQLAVVLARAALRAAVAPSDQAAAGGRRRAEPRLEGEDVGRVALRGRRRPAGVRAAEPERAVAVAGDGAGGDAGDAGGRGERVEADRVTERRAGRLAQPPVVGRLVVVDGLDV